MRSINEDLDRSFSQKRQKLDDDTMSLF